MDSDRESIDVSEKTLKRYEKKKAAMDAADPNLPDMSNDQFMKCLLDTLEAVNGGFYEVTDEAQRKRTADEPEPRLTGHAYEDDNGEIGNELRDLIREWREVAAAYHKGGAEGKAKALIECAEELENRIDE